MLHLQPHFVSLPLCYTQLQLFLSILASDSEYSKSNVTSGELYEPSSSTSNSSYNDKEPDGSNEPVNEIHPQVNERKEEVNQANQSSSSKENDPAHFSLIDFVKSNSYPSVCINHEIETIQSC